MEFESMDILDASRATDALKAALVAMAHYRTERAHMNNVAAMLVAAEIAQADAFRRHEKERAEQ